MVPYFEEHEEQKQERSNDPVVVVLHAISQLVGVKPDWGPFTTHYLNTTTNALLTVNASANCFVYCFSGRRLRLDRMYSLNAILWGFMLFHVLSRRSHSLGCI